MKKNRTIAVMNQKGGVGKTTTGMGVDKKSKNSLKTMFEYIIMEEEFDPKEGVVRQEEGIDIVPANILLEGGNDAYNALYTAKRVCSEEIFGSTQKQL